MAKVRSELHGYPISPHRKKAILTGIGASVWRAMKSGAVQAGKALGRLLHELIQRLREANRIGESVRCWSSWSGWCVREIIDLQRAKLARDKASARFSAQIRREKEEAKGSVKAFLSEVGAGSLREYLQGLTESAPYMTERQHVQGQRVWNGPYMEQRNRLLGVIPHSLYGQ